jgi:hypothetical protein
MQAIKKIGTLPMDQPVTAGHINGLIAFYRQNDLDTVDTPVNRSISHSVSVAHDRLWSCSSSLHRSAYYDKNGIEALILEEFDPTTAGIDNCTTLTIEEANDDPAAAAAQFGRIWDHCLWDAFCSYSGKTEQATGQKAAIYGAYSRMFLSLKMERVKETERNSGKFGLGLHLGIVAKDWPEDAKQLAHDFLISMGLNGVQA